MIDMKVVFLENDGNICAYELRTAVHVVSSATHQSLQLVPVLSRS
jgi:hypothetical protein